MGQEGEKYILSLRRHIFTTPRCEITGIISILFIILASFLISWNIEKTLILFAIPYILVNLLDFVMVKVARIYFPGRRIITMNLLMFTFGIVQLVIFRIFFPFELSLFLSFSFSVFTRFLVYLVFMRRTKVLGVITALNYNTVYAIISLLYYPQYLVPFIVSTFIYTIMAWLLLRVSVARFIREFSEDPLWFISTFINYLSNATEDNVHHLNRFFESIYTKRRVPISSMFFWRDGSLKAAFVFPYIHPGPFGNVGGSNITEKLRKFTGYENLFVFHTTTTHDNNVASDEDVKKIANTITNSLEKAGNKYNRISEAVRFRVDGFEVWAQIIGNYPVVALLPTLRIFDDVDLNAGLALRRRLKKKYPDSAIIDAHNNFDENALPLILTARDMQEIVKKVMELKSEYPLRMGFAQKSLKGKSIGPDGIKVAVFECGNKKIAYVLLDGNNIKRGLREKIREELLGIVDDAEIFSTDNHIVNYDIMDLNPFGDRDDWGMIIEAVKGSVKKAVENIEDVEVSMHTEIVEMTMAGRGQLQKMTDITKEAIKTVKIVAPLTLATGFILSILSFILI